MTTIIAVTFNGLASGQEAREFRALICPCELSARPPDPCRRGRHGHSNSMLASSEPARLCAPSRQQPGARS